MLRIKIILLFTLVIMLGLASSVLAARGETPTVTNISRKILRLSSNH